MAESPPVYVLDSFAVMAHFQAESGGEKVLEFLERAGNSEVVLAMSLINVGEVVYLAGRAQGKKQAQAILEDLRSLPIKFYDATEERILAAAWMKSEYPISYADAFAASLVQELGGALITGDPEFRRLKKIIDIFWLG
jgi:predicted nucleic acid-binding protein